MRTLTNRRGFSLAEVLIVIALLGILASVVLLNLGSSDVKAKEANLQANVETLRTALDLFRSDHGFYPGQPGDTHAGSLTATQLERKLTRYTRDNGAYSTTKSTTYKYGPYLKEFPVEPFTGSTAIHINTTDERTQATMAQAIAGDAAAVGGWHYEVLTGQICAYLGSAYPQEYARF